MDRTKKKRSVRKQLDGVTNWLLAAIPVIGFCIFGLMPMALSLGLSFTSIKVGFAEEISFVGFDNFSYLFHDERFLQSIWVTVYYMLSVPLVLAMSLYCAYLVNRATKGKKFYRSVLFIPYVCSTVAVSLAWRIIYEKNYGIINTVLDQVGLGKIPWISSPEMFMPATILMSVWSGCGFCIILYQAALSNINASYYEAAEIDGATPAQIFFKITLPAVSPTTFYLLIMRVIGGLQVMAEPEILAGGPANTTNLGYMDITLVRYLYNLAFGSSRLTAGLGVASAAGWILAIFIMLITWLNFRMSKKWVNYDMN